MRAFEAFGGGRRVAYNQAADPPSGADKIKRTNQPKKRQRRRVHGFRARMASPGGVKVLKARRLKGRRTLAPTGRRGR